MKYLIYGKEEYLINIKIKEIIGSVNQTEGYEVLNFNLEIDTIKDMEYAWESVSLFSTRKIIVVKNVKKLFDDKNSIIFKKNNDSILILSCFETIEKAKLKLCSDFEIVNFDKLKEEELVEYIIKKVGKNGFKISKSLVLNFLNKTTSDLYIINNELDKLFLASKGTIISQDIIESVVSNYSNVDIFELVNAIVNKEKIKAINLVEQLLAVNSDIIGLLVMVSNQLRLIYQVKILAKDDMSQGEIATYLDIHPFRVKKILEVVDLYSTSKLLKLMSELSLLDMEIKSINVDKKTRLELFILGL